MKARDVCCDRCLQKCKLQTLANCLAGAPKSESWRSPWTNADNTTDGRVISYHGIYRVPSYLDKVDSREVVNYFLNRSFFFFLFLTSKRDVEFFALHLCAFADILNHRLDLQVAMSKPRQVSFQRTIKLV